MQLWLLLACGGMPGSVDVCLRTRICLCTCVAPCGVSSEGSSCHLVVCILMPPHNWRDVHLQACDDGTDRSEMVRPPPVLCVIALGNEAEGGFWYDVRGRKDLRWPGPRVMCVSLSCGCGGEAGGPTEQEVKPRCPYVCEQSCHGQSRLADTDLEGPQPYSQIIWPVG